MQDEDLVAAVRGGDTAAMGQLFTKYRPVVYRKCLYDLAGDTHAAWDATAETFTIAWSERLKGLRDPAKLRPWLLAIAHRRALREFRDVRSVLVDEVPELPHPAAEPAAAVEDDDTVRSRWRALEAAAAALEEGDRDLLGDYVLDVSGTVPRPEIAERRGVSQAGLDVAFSRLRQRVDQAVWLLMLLRRNRVERCPGFAEELDRLGEQVTPTLRKAVWRHARDCENCRSHIKPAAITAGLLLGLPILPSPEQDWVPDVELVSFRRLLGRRVRVAAVVIAVLLLGGLVAIGWPVRRTDQVGALSEGSSVPTTSASTVATTAATTSAVTTSAEPSSPPSSSSRAPVSSQQQTGAVASVSTAAVADTSGPAFGVVTRSSAQLSQTWNGQVCGGQATEVLVSVMASDPSGVGDASLTGVIGGRSRTWPMKDYADGSWRAEISYDIADHTGPSGTVVLTVTAVDGKGNKATGQAGSVKLISCTPG